jgi:hypothetical protein
MELTIAKQASHSRAELLLRTFFGWLYIAAPHMFVLFFVNIWASILHFISWWVILFTGRYPQSFFEFQVKMISWNLRLQASLYNLVDGYPGIGPGGSHPGIVFTVVQPESFSRGLLLLRTFFGFLYVGIPHAFCLFFRLIATAFINFLSWWAILFTGSIPDSWFEFSVGTLRWSTRLGLYMANMTDTYPPFTGKPENNLTATVPSGQPQLTA